jgi:hypothetical protein
MIGTKIALPGILLNTQDFSSVRLPTQAVTYPLKCFKHNAISEIDCRV